MKRFIAFLLVAVLLLSLAACNQSGANVTESTQTEPMTDEQILQQRREAVVAEMRRSMTFLWRPTEDITYSKQRSSNGLENDEEKNVFTFKKGRLYSGLPYTHGSGSADDFNAFATSCDENGIYTISGMTTEVLTGVDTLKENRRARVGSDCADSVFWAWSRIAASVSFIATYEMTEAFGCIKVGEFICDSKKHANTKEVAATNGQKVMFDAYSKLQPGDAVVHNNGAASHAMMVCEVNPVIKANGEYDLVRSHVKVIDQTSGNLFSEKYYYDENLKENVYYCGNVEKLYQFTTLFESGYLPFTCKELIDPTPLAEEKVVDSQTQHSLDTMFEGTFSSDYAVSNVTVVISDSQGKEVQKATCFGIESDLKAFDVTRFAHEMEQDVMVGKVDLDALPAGSYQCEFRVMLSTGNTYPVRQFAFQK